MKRIFVFTLLLIAASSFVAHKYYHSHAELLLSSSTGNAEAVIELYWHDLEVSLSKESDKKVSVKDSDWNERCSKYFKKHFILKDSIAVEVEQNFVGTSIKADQVLVYIEFKKVKTFKGYSMMNNLLMNEFPQQVNQVNLKGPVKKSVVFTTRKIDQDLF
jgi:hypothetical protein